jgi:hypothetical protein
VTVDPTALTLLIGAAGTTVVLIIKALSDKQLAAIRALSERTTAVESTAKVIEGHVNGAATRNAGIIQAQEQQLTMLRDQITDLKQTALLLSQTKAVIDAVVAPKADA